MFKLSDNPSIDTATKLVGLAVVMFAFVFVVMVPLYDVLCDALGINGKTRLKLTHLCLRQWMKAES